MGSSGEYVLHVWGKDEDGNRIDGWLTESWMGLTRDLSRADRGSYGYFEKAPNHSFITCVLMDGGKLNWEPEKVSVAASRGLDHRSIVLALLDRAGAEGLPAFLGVHPDLDKLVSARLGQEG